MTTTALLLVLVAALAHASWTFLAKHAGDCDGTVLGKPYGTSLRNCLPGSRHPGVTGFMS